MNSTCKGTEVRECVTGGEQNRGESDSLWSRIDVVDISFQITNYSHRSCTRTCTGTVRVDR